MIYIKKRNGQIERYDENKIISAIEKAMESVEEINHSASLEIEKTVKEEIDQSNTIWNVEKISDRVEELLMKYSLYKTAKSFILYRNSHAEDRNIENKRLFIEEYKRAKNASTGSKYDANANVESKNISTLSNELHKRENILLNRKLMTSKIKDLFGESVANEYLRQLKSHEIYKHDETSIMPYTYSGKETILVSYKGRILNVSLEDLYEICDSEEITLDKEKDVCGKYPEDMLVIDADGMTIISRLIKKKRSRDLVIVKTEYGENVIVTDNHPLIVEDNKNSTIEAQNATGHKQLRVDVSPYLRSVPKKTNIPWKEIRSDFQENGSFLSWGSDTSNSTKRFTNQHIQMTEGLGYFVGIFIAEGYIKDDQQIIIKMKDREILSTASDHLHRATGIYSHISELPNNYYRLTVSSPPLVDLLMKVFKINKLSQNKQLPIGLYEYSDDFNKGLLAGLIDGDGTINLQTEQISIRLSSRKIISQLAYLFKYFGYSPSMMYQDPVPSENDLIQSAYPMFGINSSFWNFSEKLTMSTKLRNATPKRKCIRYKNSGWKEIIAVKKIENEKFLQDNDYIYDITTESNTFIMNNLWVHNCVAINMYPFLEDGLSKLGGHSSPPTHLQAFNGSFINLVFAVASQFAGAVATPEYLMYMDYFIRKEYGDEYYLNTGKQVVSSNRPRTIEKVIEDSFQQVVYSMNQPAAARGYQAVFWNIGYFDRHYFDSLFGNFVFPDFSRPKWESLDWLQRKFMNWFNVERTKKALTFPVETLALLVENGDTKDKEYGQLAAEMYAKGHSFFTYMSESADSLSSCCFSGEQKIIVKSSNGVHHLSFDDFKKAKHDDLKKNLVIFHNGSWVKGKLVALPSNRRMYKITTANKKEMIVSDNHIHPTLRGDVSTDSLIIGDKLLFNMNKLDSYPEKDEHLTFEQGYAVGAFVGDGSFGSDFLQPDGELKPMETQYSLNIEDCPEIVRILSLAVSQISEEAKISLGTPINNTVPCRIYSKKIADFIIRWTDWIRGTYAYNKKINMDIFTQSYEFRKGILSGWYATDGGNSNRCYTTSPQLAEQMEVLLTSLGMPSIIDVVDRTKEKVVIREKEYCRNYPTFCVRWYDPKNKRSMDGVYTYKNNSMYFEIVSIEEVEYKGDSIYCFEMENENEPYFTLPNGIITHNCRLRNEIDKNEFSFSLGAGGVATGSKSVITININRLVQNAVREKTDIGEAVRKQVKKIHQYQIAYNEIMKDNLNAGLLPVYDAGFIYLNKQFLTIGINGAVEAAQFLGLDITPNKQYYDFLNTILSPIYEENKKAKTKEIMFNTEFVPAESLGVKNADWDRIDGYYVPRDVYNSYFYIVEDANTNLIDKFKLHGKEAIQYLDGGSALHANLDEHLSESQYRQLLRIAAKEGCNYFTFNIPNTICNNCGAISKHKLNKCHKCGSENLDYLTRVIGYLKRVSSFSLKRQEEEGRRFYDDLRQV